MLGLEWYSKITEDKIGRDIVILSSDEINSVTINGDIVYQREHTNDR